MNNNLSSNKRRDKRKEKIEYRVIGRKLFRYVHKVYRSLCIELQDTNDKFNHVKSVYPGAYVLELEATL